MCMCEHMCMSGMDLRCDESVIFQKDGREHSHFSYLLQCSDQEQRDLRLYPASRAVLSEGCWVRGSHCSELPILLTRRVDQVVWQEAGPG